MSGLTPAPIGVRARQMPLKAWHASQGLEVDAGWLSNRKYCTSVVRKCKLTAVGPSGEAEGRRTGQAKRHGAYRCVSTIVVVIGRFVPIKMLYSAYLNVENGEIRVLVTLVVRCRRQSNKGCRPLVGCKYPCHDSNGSKGDRNCA